MYINPAHALPFHASDAANARPANNQAEEDFLRLMGWYSVRSIKNHRNVVSDPISPE
jgi:hypothetical protein